MITPVVHGQITGGEQIFGSFFMPVAFSLTIELHFVMASFKSFYLNYVKIIYMSKLYVLLSLLSSLLLLLLDSVSVVQTQNCDKIMYIKCMYM